MNTVMNLDPLLRQAVGFDRFNDLFENLFQADKNVSGYPPYNIEKLNEDQYRITMAVAGFSEKDLSIIAQENSLIVSGKHTEEKTEEGVSYLHRGIAGRSFERKFSLADRIVVEGADLENGLLRIALKVVIPEEAKPRMIPIHAHNGKTLEATDTATGKTKKTQ
jgi:molecular chaperone IbpA